MTTIVVGGDCATTSALAVAAGWPTSLDGPTRSTVVVEADPTGGSLAAWLDAPLSPSLSSVVTALRQAESAGSTTSAMRTVDAMIRRASSGVRFLPAPFRTREARNVVAEAEGATFPLLGHSDDLIAIVDVGRLDPLRLPGALRSASCCLVTHRQDAASASAATVRLERLTETVAALRDAGQRVCLAVIGDSPFGLDEIVEFVTPNDASWLIPVDPLAASVLAGRSGVSARRLARLPLMRSTAQIAADLNDIVTDQVPDRSHPTLDRDVG